MVWTAAGARGGRARDRGAHAHLVVLDLLLGDGHGLDVLDRVRASDGLASRIDPSLPVIVLSGRAGDTDRVRSLERGADDHLCKPFLYNELVARIHAVLRRSHGPAPAGRDQGGGAVDRPVTRTARLGRRADSSCRPRSSGCCSRWPRTRCGSSASSELLRDVWGYRSPGSTRTLDAHACRLRKKLGRDDGRQWVLNVRGVGYRLTEVP